MNQERYTEISDFQFVDLDMSQTPDPFANAGTPVFERLLEAGLRGYLVEGQGVWAFGLAADWIAGHGELYDGIKVFFDHLRAEQQISFRQAVANLLAVLEPRRENVPVFEYLLLLASLLPAPEILRVLPARLGNGYFGTNAHLFERALLAVTRLAAPRQDAVECLRALISSRHFVSDYAGVALLALCRADGTDFVGHMNNMRAHLRKMLPRARKSTGAKALLRTWAEQVLEVLTLHPLVVALPQLNYFDPRDPAGANDTWLLEGLLGGRSPLLRCVQNDEGQLTVFLSAKPDHRELININAASFGELLRFLRDSNYIHGAAAPQARHTHRRRARKALPDPARESALIKIRTSEAQVSNRFGRLLINRPLNGIRQAGSSRPSH